MQISLHKINETSTKFHFKTYRARKYISECIACHLINKNVAPTFEYKRWTQTVFRQ